MIDKDYIREVTGSGFSRLIQIMSGLVPAVKTFGIMTWENPLGEKMPAAFNNKQQENLKDLLIRGAHSYIQIKGKFGYYENPFFVFNISRKTLEDYGVEGKQAAVIFGEILGPKVNELKRLNTALPTVRFIYIDLQGGQNSVRNVWVPLSEDKENNFSQYKGRKFYIPFFDKRYEMKGSRVGNVMTDDIIILDENHIFYKKDFDLDEIKLVEERFSKYNYQDNTPNNYHLRGVTSQMLKKFQNSPSFKRRLISLFYPSIII